VKEARLDVLGLFFRRKERTRHLFGEILGNYKYTIILGVQSSSSGCIDAGECLLELEFYARQCSLLYSPFYNCRPRTTRHLALPFVCPR
jgi:hypothetical protein